MAARKGFIEFIIGGLTPCSMRGAASPRGGIDNFIAKKGRDMLLRQEHRKLS
jgi:hypothetical protein